MAKQIGPRRFGTARLTLAAVGGVVVLAVLTFAGIYLTQFSGSHVSAVGLATPSASAASSTTASWGSLTAATAPGTWSVTTGSFAGYRVREQLAVLSAPSDAVGRTSAVSGSMALARSGTTYAVTAASITVDVTTLTSDRAMRDRRIHTMGLESDRYPTATFTLTSPITLPAEAALGQVVHVSATGALIDPRDDEDGHHPHGRPAERIQYPGRGLADLPLQRVQHGAPQYRWVCDRPGQCDPGVFPGPSARVG